MVRLVVLACVGCGRVGFAEHDAAPDAPEPIGFVQNMDGHVNTITANVTFAAPIGAHHAIVACFDFNSNGVTVSDVSDSLGNTYAVIAGPFDRVGWRHYIAFAADSAPGVDTISITCTQFTSMQIYLHEYAGIRAVDQTAMAEGASTAADGMASGFATTTSAPELIFGYGETGRGGVGSGFTQRSSLDGNLTEDRIVDIAGDYQATATMVTGSDWTMMMATFR